VAVEEWLRRWHSLGGSAGVVPPFGLEGSRSAVVARGGLDRAGGLIGGECGRGQGANPSLWCTCGRPIVETGLMATRNSSGAPDVMPPREPPPWFVAVRSSSTRLCRGLGGRAGTAALDEGVVVALAVHAPADLQVGGEARAVRLNPHCTPRGFACGSP
jgi:hypothetical protein